MACCDPEFVEWAQQRGVVLQGVTPGLVDVGWRGVIANEPLQPGAAVMRVPGAVLMSVLSARADGALASVLERHPHLTSHQARLQDAWSDNVVLPCVVAQL